MRIALVSYRSKPHCGGQGVYVRHLSRELVELGHTVEVFSGQPYPELDEGVGLTKVPSLDLYREPDPFRMVWPWEFRDLIDVQEFAIMCTAGFPEPRTFGKRVLRVLRGRKDDFDIVHDNQVLAHGVMDIEKELDIPVLTTVHHPITFDRRVDIAAAPLRKKLSLRRWYGFLKMQGAVVRRARWILLPSESSKVDAANDFGADLEKMQVIPLGVDDCFVPPTEPRVKGRLVAMASADAPMKGIATLLEAFAKLLTERDLELLLVTKPTPGGRTEKLIEELGIGDHIKFVNGISDSELVQVMGSAEIAVVPSLYEGFSLPTAELMACETPLVVSRTGAIPEVVGPDGLCAELVTPGDVGELATTIADLLDDPERRERLGKAGRVRAQELFSWAAVAKTTAEAYERVLADYAANPTSTHKRVKKIKK
ncbi:glycosyltransferase family 4 protein [Nocardioides marmorisolisilvae]|uniref:Glycosyltransferase family 1 protein n=1 Tax=Nocardioides marmorisolisilvae TaxID=1542737 RepID=A0A3N0DVA0_9ACTN|nr:glycosyltransferase family 4 protein [Nocardioides marmorisolisilvae]RNL79540.1 glycosyltransferase family 1 protein [Nocardioides marmorisolisilvae]